MLQFIDIYSDLRSSIYWRGKLALLRFLNIQEKRVSVSVEYFLGLSGELLDLELGVISLG